MPQRTGGGTACVKFSAEINPSTSESLIATLTQLATKGIDHVYLALSTPEAQ